MTVKITKDITDVYRSHTRISEFVFSFCKYSLSTKLVFLDLPTFSSDFHYLFICVNPSELILCVNSKKIILSNSYSSLCRHLKKSLEPPPRSYSSGKWLSKSTVQTNTDIYQCFVWTFWNTFWHSSSHHPWFGNKISSSFCQNREETEEPKTYQDICSKFLSIWLNDII